MGRRMRICRAGVNVKPVADKHDKTRGQAPLWVTQPRRK